ncbi:phosphatidate cytidylyltransferase [Thermosporothrix hazakensis]|jgi:phosphatidate cytidylyltransferase|nr:phosphatidate cytidylyltransferase [Thermosporothrix hazakensis]BBH88643.1 phosphatidate cytidylyltransferase [Thermosporothrix sp. COM3]GCE46829.1 phosphatidate cytidylyltransferase [Thermosporothrix hazakensis]
MPTSPENNKKKAALGQRLLTAFVLMPVVLLCGWFGGWAVFAASALVVLVGSFELYNMLHHAGYRPLIWVSLALGLLFLLAAMFPSHRLFLLELGLGGVLVLSFLWLFFRERLEGAMVDWALTLAIALYLGWPSSYFILLRGNEIPQVHLGNGLQLSLPSGIWWTLALLLGVWGFDSAAFFAGRLFGRHKMAPRISPAKTWEGVAGGLIFSVLAALLCTVGPLGLPWYLAVLLGLLIGVAATVGDLAESLIKRQTHVKDSGQIMPGHGGLLDRTDSLLFAVIVVYLFASVVRL